DIRSSVVSALVIVIDWETRKKEGARAAAGAARPDPSTVKGMIFDRILHNPPPKERALEDAGRVLWRSDGKSFLAAVIGGLRLNKRKFPESTPLYLKEVRSRLRIDFATPEEWASWWESSKDRSLPEIFAACQRRVSEESARHWRSMVRRLRETRDAERVLTSIQDTVRGANALELRLAAVDELGLFAEWIRDVILPANDVEKPTTPWYERSFALLLSIAEGKAQAHERPIVRRAALVAMRHFDDFLRENEEGLASVAKLVSQSFDGAVTAGDFRVPGPGRTRLIESLETIGALRIADTRESVETFLRSMKAHGDIALIRLAVTALGRLVHSSLSAETAELLIDLYGYQPAEPTAEESALADLRKACVSALNARPADPNVRKTVFTFYETVLASPDAKLRILAILGLGTLAQDEEDQDDAALSRLVKIVESSDSFGPQEMIAAVNAIAYVGGRAALGQFLPLLGARDTLIAKDRSIYDNLWRRVVGLTSSEGFAFAATELTQHARDEDSLVFLEIIVGLSAEPELAKLLSTDGLDTGNKDRLLGLWLAVLSLARAQDLVETPATAVQAPIEALRLLQEKHTSVREMIPAETKMLESYLALRKGQEALSAKIAAATKAEDADVEALADELIEHIVKSAPASEKPEGNANERWFALRWVEHQVEKHPEGAKTLATLLHTRLSAKSRAGLFKGLPENFATRYLEQLEKLGGAKPAPKKKDS
ncbi:MAG: hypothetical protein AAF517_13650, partial [Planctomycetota bacterium]